MSSASSEPVLVSPDDSVDGGSFPPEYFHKKSAHFDVSKSSSHSSSSGDLENLADANVASSSGLGRDRTKLSTSSYQSDSATTTATDSSSEVTVVEQGYNPEEEERETDSGGDAEAAFLDEASASQQWLSLSGLGDFDSSTSPTASFVKCMIEDAMGMEDAAAKHETDSGSSEEKSEGSKIDSEFEKSMHSGHESSDEIETTTSSDIEIISTPTPNGEKNIVDLSPLRFSLQVCVYFLLC
jgi:hypothetical protein